MIKVALIDDHNLFAEGMKSLFESIEIADLDYTFTSLEHLLLLKASDWPQVLLLDINLEKESGLEICRKLRKLKAEIKIIAVTMVNELSMVRAMINAGADGYLLKNTSKDELIKAMETVLEGEIYIGSHIKEAVAKPLAQKKKAVIYTITRREKEVLSLIVQEKTTQEIADLLGIAFTTVETHRKNLATKLGVRNLAGLVRVAILENLI